MSSYHKYYLPSTCLISSGWILFQSDYSDFKTDIRARLKRLLQKR